MTEGFAPMEFVPVDDISKPPPFAITDSNHQGIAQPSPNTASVEISENAKGEPRITVKLQRAEGLHEIAGEVIEVYRMLRLGLGSSDGV
jgi:hypothetical protein